PEPRASRYRPDHVAEHLRRHASPNVYPPPSHQVLNSTAEMSLPRTFVSFSSTDIRSYRTMQMWKANENIDFNFADFQLDEAINSQNPYYIKAACRNKIVRSDTFILLIGTDTWTKTEFVQAEVEVAIEKECRLIAV